MNYSNVLKTKLLLYCSALIISIQTGNALLITGKNSIVSNAKVQQLIDKEIAKQVEQKLKTEVKQYKDKITELESNNKSLAETNKSNQELQDKAKKYEEKITELENNLKSVEEKNNTSKLSNTSSVDNITLCAIQDDSKTQMRLSTLLSQKELEQNKHNIVQLISQLDYQKSNYRQKVSQQIQQLQENNINNNSSALSIIDDNITKLRSNNMWYKVPNNFSPFNTVNNKNTNHGNNNAIYSGIGINNNTLNQNNSNLLYDRTSAFDNTLNANNNNMLYEVTDTNHSNNYLFALPDNNNQLNNNITWYKVTNTNNDNNNSLTVDNNNSFNTLDNNLFNTIDNNAFNMENNIMGISNENMLY